MSKTTRRVYKIAAAAAFTAGSVAAIPATFAAEAPADQNGTTVAVTQHPNGEVNVEVTAPAPAATEAPKTEAPAPAATEAPKTEETPKAEAPAPAATEAPKTEAPKTETPAPAATEAPKAETPAPASTEAPKAEAPKAETPAPAATEAPKAETPAPAATEAPKTEAPAPAATEAPKTEETPKAEAPAPAATEAPKAEVPAPAATEAPKTEETPKADPKTEQANPAIEIEETDFPADATINTITVRASGFQGAKVGASVNVSIYALDANQQITGEPIATITVDAGQIKDGAFNASLSVPAAQLPAGASYALVAVSNPQAQPAEKLVALSSFKVTETTTPRDHTPKADETPAPETPKADETPAPEAPKADETPAPETPKADETPAPETPKADETPAPETPAPETPKAETPKADETPAPETPAVPEPQNATLTTESASLDPNDEYNVVTVNGAGFTHESASRGVQVAIYRLDADGNITGEALAVQDVPASEIMEGTFTTKLSVRADRLLPGYVYALVATSDPNGLVHQVAVTTASVSDADHPAPTVPAASNDDNTTVRDNGDGTTSVFTAEMSEDGSVTVTETRVPSSQAPKAKVGNTPVTASSQSGHTVSARDTAGRTTSDSSSKPQLAHTGAEGVAGIAGVGAAALIAGAALMLLRRRSL